jgi:UDP-N-acetylglucosamine 1-carboxyvinyltransferase
MDKIRITGRRPLQGEVTISGAKNSALPCIIASTLTAQTVHLENVPRRARDITTIIQMLEQLGHYAEWEDSRLMLRGDGIDRFDATYDMVRTMRASVLVIGPLLARFGKAIVSLPGGCAIGARPIDMHLKGFKALGATVQLEHGYIHCSGKKLKGTRYRFPGVTVTGTENLVMAAVLAEGKTILENCAIEPEVGDLIQLLQKMGAQIEGENTPTLTIYGVDSLQGTEHRIIADRIEAGTFLMAGAITGGKIIVNQCIPEHLTAPIEKLLQNGCEIEVSGQQIRIAAPDTLRPSDIETEPYPGFATDLQAQYMALMTQADGNCAIHETIFENRFMHVGELQRMGAEIRISGRTATVFGKTSLSGASLMATDLRASASLILAGLVAEGDTIVQRIYHIDRGYEKIEEKLRLLGAQIERISS